MNIFSRPKKLLVLDVGSASIKGLVLEKDKKAKPAVEAFACQEFKSLSVEQSLDFKKTVFKNNFLKLLKKLNWQENQFQGTVIGFSPQFVKAQIATVEWRRQKPSEKIDEAEKKMIYQTVFKQAQKKLLDDVLKQQKISPHDIEILEQITGEKRISGYRIDSIVGQKGENLALGVISVFALKNYKKFMDFFKKILGGKNTIVSHEIKGILELIKESEFFSATFIDVGTEFTQLFSANRSLRTSSIIDMGGNDFTKILAETLGLSNEESENFQEKYVRAQLSPGSQGRFEKMMLRTVQQWLKKVKKEIPTAASQFFLFGGGASLLQKLLKDSRFQELSVKNLPLKDPAGLLQEPFTIPVALLGL